MEHDSRSLTCYRGHLRDFAQLRGIAAAVLVQAAVQPVITRCFPLWPKPHCLRLIGFAYFWALVETQEHQEALYHMTFVDRASAARIPGHRAADAHRDRNHHLGL